MTKIGRKVNHGAIRGSSVQAEGYESCLNGKGSAYRGESAYKVRNGEHMGHRYQGIVIV